MIGIGIAVRWFETEKQGKNRYGNAEMRNGTPWQCVDSPRSWKSIAERRKGKE